LEIQEDSGRYFKGDDTRARLLKEKIIKLYPTSPEATGMTMKAMGVFTSYISVCKFHLASLEYGL
jgi:hypothetical protein